MEDTVFHDALKSVNRDKSGRQRVTKEKANWEIKERERSHGGGARFRLSGLITQQRELASLKARHLIYSVQLVAATETAN